MLATRAPLRVITRSFASATSAELTFRQATTKDVDTFTRRTIKEGWHVGPYDYQCAFAQDPKGFFVGEVDKELASHVCVLRYPNHHAFFGGNVVESKFRGRGFGGLDLFKAVKESDQNYTIGNDVDMKLRKTVENYGFQVVWDTYVAKFSLDKIASNLAKMSTPPDVAVKPISDVPLEKLVEYDGVVFGAERRNFIKMWANVPGSFGWAVVRDNSLLGYTVVKQVIRGAGTEIGLTIAPLFADNADIAKVLLKTAAEYCLSNKAVPKTTLEMFYPVGENCGEDAPQLMKELDADLLHIAHRMYTKGAPARRQTKKIYGIASPTFD